MHPITIIAASVASGGFLLAVGIAVLRMTDREWISGIWELVADSS